MRATALLPCLLLLPWSIHEASGKAPDFNRDIRPILAENCFHCHGPDKEARKAKLRLDTFEGATRGGEITNPIVPGNPEESELIARILATDPDEVMPPPKAKRSLTEAQKDLLKKWIASGAKYDEHWAWKPPARATTPQVSAANKVNNPIDAFLLRRLESEGLGFSDRASSAKLLRRLSLDLIGLPPSPEDLDRYSKASGSALQGSPDGVTVSEAEAYEAEVNRLLASPRFGERWARPWLDLARYADSNGFQADQLRPSWAFRDWVIDALNANMPYDRFTIEQLAGDLLPNATTSQKIATGFHRTVTCNVEAGVHPEANRTNQVVDRVNTTATVWLGVTLECAQCHDHKYDPFSMKDYYSLFAFFNNTPLEVQLPKNKTDVSHDFVGPFLDLPLSSTQKESAAALDREIASAAKEREDLLATNVADLEAWENAAATQQAAWQAIEVINFRSNGGADHRVLKDGSVLLTGKVPDTTTYVLELRTKLKNITAFKLEALTHPEIPGKGPGRGDPVRSNFVLNELEASLRTNESTRPITLRDAQADFSQNGWNVSGAIDGKPKTGWAVAPQFGKPHEATFQLSEPLDDPASSTIVITLVQNFGQGRVLGNLRFSAISDPSGIGAIPSRIVTILKKPRAKRTKKERATLNSHFAQTTPTLKKLDAKLAQLKKEREGFKSDRTLVMVELPDRRKTHILARGNYLTPQAEVQAGTPTLFPPIETTASRTTPTPDRLALARWLVRRDNPLTARVAVNRWWAEIFGNGIVETLEDFGTQSEPPTHPELLDWLAVEFMESGWDMKHLLKTIVMSQAYQQSSRLTPSLLEKDPRNLLHARAPRFRMDAERLRDNSLAISGLLSTRMHGKPIMPYQPPGLWRQTGRNEPKWEEQKDENRWRRGIYIVYRRAAPYPSMVNFDAPDRGSCTVRRARTNTPSQALTLLNDPAFVEMALALADRILSEAASPEARARYAFQLVIARSPTAKETLILDKLVQDRESYFATNPELARNQLNNPNFIYKPAHKNQIELAAWFNVANALLNLDETITRD